VTGKHAILLTLAIALVSGGATATFVYTREPSEADTNLARGSKGGQSAGQNSATETETNRLLQSLVRDMATMRAQIAGLEQRTAAMNEDKSSELVDDKAEPSDSERAEQRDAALKAQRELLESSLQNEAKDRKWVDGAQTKLGSAYGVAAAQGVRFVDADCRSTMCKVNLELDKADRKTERELRKLMDKPAPWSGTRMMHMDRQTGQVTMFMMREGHALPTLAGDYENGH
jgi:hypothetical protein